MGSFGFGDELSELGATARLTDSESKVNELQKENAILKMQNKNEISNKLIKMESDLEKAKQENEKL